MTVKTKRVTGFMATFAKNTFNATKYAAFRPHYPRYLFDLIIKYHSDGILPNDRKIDKLPGRTDLAVDLGCGTGERCSRNALKFTNAHGIL